MKLRSREDADFIIQSLVKASTIDLEELTLNAYRFINICSGFIAHYNIEGFKENYELPVNLGDEILFFQENNQWKNFTPKDPNFDYMMQKKDIYNQVCKGIREYRQSVLPLDNEPWTLQIEGEGKGELNKLLSIVSQTKNIKINYCFKHLQLNDHDFMMNILDKSIDHLNIHAKEE